MRLAAEGESRVARAPPRRPARGQPGVPSRRSMSRAWLSSARREQQSNGAHASKKSGTSGLTYYAWKNEAWRPVGGANELNTQTRGATSSLAAVLGSQVRGQTRSVFPDNLTDEMARTSGSGQSCCAVVGGPVRPSMPAAAALDELAVRVVSAAVNSAVPVDIPRPTARTGCRW
jgi:hypothetical protein